MSFKDLEFAFEMVVSSGELGECSAFISRKTGQVVEYVPEDISGEPPEEWVLEDADYIQIPDKYELGLGNRLVFRFVDECVPELEEQVRFFFRRKGAYGRLKALFERKGCLQAWYDFEALMTAKVLRDWCESEGVVFSDEAAASEET